MRVNERKSFADIATELGRSPKSVRSAWTARCASQLPKEALRQVWNVRHWSVEEEERFIQLHNQGLTIKDIALQFPSRSGYSIVTKLYQLRPRFAVSRRKGSEVLTKFDWIALKTALEPYLDQKRTNWTRMNMAFPQFSREQITRTIHSMRQKRKTEAETVQSDNEGVGVKDE
nr:MYB transcription factor 17 [Cladosporium cladosporioides]